MDSTAFDPRAPVEFRPHYGAAALIFPGLGHVAGGQVRRGIYIGIGVLGLFFSGLLVGGIDVVDKQEDRLWFMAQGLVGPIAFGVDYIHQNHFKVLDPSIRGRAPVARTALPGEIRDPGAAFFELKPPQRSPMQDGKPTQPPPNMKSLAKVNELGTLFCAVAGMMNLIVAIDAMFPRIRRREGEGA
ncbi:MAG TPA: DUF6677 family protein [Phycisphaerales bacterium]|nr:DUF6677 family protein [Phycisphaerales bacterium]